MLYAACWMIWLKRNNIIFNNKVWSVEEIVDIIIKTISEWAMKRIVTTWARCPHGIILFGSGDFNLILLHGFKRPHVGLRPGRIPSPLEFPLPSLFIRGHRHDICKERGWWKL